MLRILTICLVVAGALASPWQGRIKAPAAEQVCYENYGCFTNDPPWSSSLRPLVALPMRPEEVGTRHLLYTRATRDEAEELIPGKDPLLEFSQFDGARRTVVIIHGWTDSSTTDWVVQTKNSLLDNEDVNVLVIDWHPGASKSYLKGVGNTRLVAAQVAALLDFIIAKTETTAAKIHIIGHSLGAHIAGYVGNRVDNIAKITALDPTQPYFEGTDPLVRIDANDAVFVEGIHTNAKAALQMGFGVTSPVGNIDIYPNGGDVQPGCKDMIGNIVGSIIDLIVFDFTGVFSNFACSHCRAPLYYAEALKTKCPFVSYRCDSYKTFEKGTCYTSCQDGSCVVIGNEKETQRALIPGQYFLHTDQSESFCMQPATMESSVSASQTKIDHGKVTIKFFREDGTITDQFILAEGAIKPGDNLSVHIDVPSHVLPDIETEVISIMHYSRTGLTPGLDPKNLSLGGVTITFVNRDLGLHTKRFYPVTLEAGVDVIVGEQRS